MFVSAKIGWPDDVAELMQVGGRVVANMSKCGVYREVYRPASMPRDQLLCDSAEWVDEIMSRPPPPAHLVEIIWEKSLKDQDAGHLEGWFTREDLDKRWGRGSWRPIVRFVVWQEGSQKWRQIDDAKQSLHNRAFGTEEQIHTTSNAVSAAVYRRMRQLNGMPLHDGSAPLGSTEDMDNAYHQIPVHTDDLCFMVVAVWSPVAREWQFGVMTSMAFGLAGAVLHFNRVPALIVAAARRLLAVPVTNFYDDFKCHDVAASASAARAFRDFVDWLGYDLAPHKRQDPAPVTKFLGNMEDCSESGADVMYLRPEPTREARTLETINGLLAARRCLSGQAASVRGRWLSLATAYACSLPRGSCVALDAQARGETTGWSHGLQRDLEAIAAAIKLAKPACIRLGPCPTNKFAAWTDASFHMAGTEPVARMCYILLNALTGWSSG